MKSRAMRLLPFVVLFWCALSLEATPTSLITSRPKEISPTPGITPTSLLTPNPPTILNAPLHSPEVKPFLTRILEASLEGSDKGTNTVASVKSLARTLSAFQPTLVSGLVTLSNEGSLNAFEKDAFIALRKEVLAANPHCKFDVVINGSSFSTASVLISKLQEVNTKLGPDVLHIMIPANNEVVYPSVLARGIEFAHAHEMLVSYEGPLSMIPDGVDIAILRAINGEVHRDEINNFKTRHHLPLVVQIPSAIQGIDRHTASLLTRLAEDQASFGYHLVYPISDFQSASVATTGTLKDASSLVRLRALMTRYN